MLRSGRGIIFQESIGAFPISLYPEKTTGAYYVDPVFADRYITMDEYFTFLKVARVNELQKIAQDLGAKHFKVVYVDQSKDVVTKKAAGALSAKLIPGKVDASGQHDSDYKGASQVRIAAEMEFEGHAPVEPTLVSAESAEAAVKLNNKLSFVSHIGFIGYQQLKNNQSKNKVNSWGIDVDGNNIVLGLYYNI